MKKYRIFIAVLFGVCFSMAASGQDKYNEIYQQMEQRNYLNVIELCDNILAFDSSDEGALFNRGIALQGLQRYQEALEAYEKISGSGIYIRASQYRSAECYELLGDSKTSFEIYNTVLEKDSSDIVAMQNSGRLLLKNGSYGKALDLYEKLLVSEPENYVYNKNAGICLYNLNRESHAARYLRKAWRNNKRDLSLPVSIANAYSRLKEPKWALAALEEGLAVDSTNIPILKTAGAIEYSMGNFEKSISYLGKAYSHGDTGVFVNKYLGISFVNLAEFELSIPHLRAYFADDTLNTEATYYLGLALSSWHFKDEGIDFLQKTIDLSYPDPAFIASIWGEMGLARADQNMVEESVKLYLKAIELDQSNSRYLFEIARVYDQKNRMKKNVVDLKAALKYFEQFLTIEQSRLEAIMEERGLDKDQISIPGYAYASRRKDEIREELFFMGELER